MTDTTFKPSEAILKHMFPQFCYNEQTGAIEKETLCSRFVLTPEYESGGAGLISTVDGYIKFADALANEGVSAGGYRLFRPETVAMMKQNQVPESLVPETVKSYLGYGFGLGVRTMLYPQKYGAKSPVGEFGGDGAAGSYSLFDTTNRLAVFYAQHVFGHTPAFRKIHPAIRDFVYTGLGIN